MTRDHIPQNRVKYYFFFLNIFFQFVELGHDDLLNHLWLQQFILLHQKVSKAHPLDMQQILKTKLCKSIIGFIQLQVNFYKQSTCISIQMFRKILSLQKVLPFP